MSVRTNTSHEKINSSITGYFSFKIGTFFSIIISISVEDIYILFRDIYMAEKVIPHEAMIALLMIARNAAIFVHIECYNILKRNFASFI